MNLRMLFLFGFAWVLLGCSAYRPIEKSTIPNDPALSTQENYSRQLDKMKTNQKMEVILINGIELDLSYRDVHSDTLYAQYNLPKNSQPVKIPLHQIQRIKVSNVNLPLTLLMGTLTGLILYGIGAMSLSGMSFSPI